MTEEMSQPPDIREIEGNSVEQFIPLDSMKRLVQATLTARFDDSGRLLPLREKRLLVTAEKAIRSLPPGERTDMVVPPKEKVIVTQGDEQIHYSYGFDVPGNLARALVPHEAVTLTKNDIERLREEETAVLHELNGSGLYIATENEKQDDLSIRINRATSAPDEVTDFIGGKMRVYFHGGVAGLHIARRMVEEGALFDNAKIWIPYLYEGTHGFRSDTPIFEVTTAAQLQSLIKTFRILKDKGELPEGINQQPLIGMRIEGLPGVYVGQKAPKTSLNGTMKELFGEPIQDAVLKVTAQSPIHVGENPPEDWFEEVAREAREIARSRATSLGVNPHNHALLVGQDPQQILTVLRNTA